MSTTILDEGPGGIWTAIAPAGVDLTPTKDASGIVTGLNISIDYTNRDYTDPATGSILGITFVGPVNDPKGVPVKGSFYQGLRLNTTIDVKNDLGVPINGYSFLVTNLDRDAVNPKDIGNVHPDDYAHFHSFTPTSLIDKATGTSNATLTLYDPNFGPASFGPATAGNAAPAFISAAGTIQPGATEELTGTNTGNTFTLHSENTPGLTGGSFELAFFPQDTIGTPLPDAVRLHPGVTTFNAQDYIFAGASQSTADLPVLQFLHAVGGSVGTLSVGNGAASPLTYGEVQQGGASTVSVAGGIQLDHGQLTLRQQTGDIFALSGKTEIEDGGTLVANPASSPATMTLNGTIDLGPGGANTLDLDKVHLNGSGAIVQRGETDLTRVGDVDNTLFDIQGGILHIADPLPFDGIIGPAPGSLGKAAMGIFGEVEVFGGAGETTKATFDTSSSVLSLTNSGGDYLGGLHFSGDTTGLKLTTFTSSEGKYLSITDQPGGPGSMIPITFT